MFREVSTLPGAANVMSDVPSKLTPFMVRAVASLVAVAALPEQAAAVVAVAALPEQEDDVVALPLKAPAKVVEVNTPVLGLYVKPVSVLGLKLPVAALANSG